MGIRAITCWVFIIVFSLALFYKNAFSNPKEDNSILLETTSNNEQPIVIPRKNLSEIIRKQVITILLENLAETLAFMDLGADKKDENGESIISMIEGIECTMGNCNKTQPDSIDSKSENRPQDPQSRYGYFDKSQNPWNPRLMNPEKQYKDENAFKALREMKKRFLSDSRLSEEARAFRRLNLVLELVKKSLLISKLDRNIYKLKTSLRSINEQIPKPDPWGREKNIKTIKEIKYPQGLKSTNEIEIKITTLFQMRSHLLETTPILKIGSLYHHLTKIGKKIILYLESQYSSCSSTYFLDDSKLEDNFCFDPIDLFYQDQLLKRGSKMLKIEIDPISESTNNVLNSYASKIKINVEPYIDKDKTIAEEEEIDQKAFNILMHENHSSLKNFFDRLVPDYNKFIEQISFTSADGIEFENHLISIFKFIYYSIKYELYLITLKTPRDVLNLLAFQSIRDAVTESLSGSPLEKELQVEIFRINQWNRIKSILETGILVGSTCFAFMGGPLSYYAVFSFISIYVTGKAFQSILINYSDYQDSMFRQYTSVVGPSLITKSEFLRVRQNLYSSLILLAINGGLSTLQFLKFIDAYKNIVNQFLQNGIERNGLISSFFPKRINQELLNIVNYWTNPSSRQIIKRIIKIGILINLSNMLYRGFISEDENKLILYNDDGWTINRHIIIDLFMYLFIAFGTTHYNLEPRLAQRFWKSFFAVTVAVYLSNSLYNQYQINDFTFDSDKLSFEAAYQAFVSHWYWEISLLFRKRFNFSNSVILATSIIYLTINSTTKNYLLDIFVSNDSMSPLEIPSGTLIFQDVFNIAKLNDEISFTDWTSLFEVSLNNLESDPLVDPRFVRAMKERLKFENYYFQITPLDL